MRRRIVRLAGSALLVAPATVAVGLAGAVPASADTTFIGWTATADANPFDLLVDNAAGLGGAHPLSEVDLPEDSVDFETGPLGHALASVLWPGSVAGNAGSLSGELPIPSQLAPLFSQLNDPVRAETFFPAGPADATYPQGAPGSVAEMTSHADGNGASAKAGLTDVSVPGFLDVQSAQGSSSTDAGAKVDASASGSFQAVNLLGGLIDVGATTSTATATSDGQSASGTTTTHVGEVTVAGHSVSYGTDGIVVGPLSATDPVSPLLSSVVNQLLSTFNVKITPVPQTETRQGASEQITSAGLAISFAVPSSLALSVDCTWLPSALAQLNAVCHAPDELTGLNFTVTIGRVTASATATPPFDDSVGAVATGTGSGAGGTGLSSGDLGSSGPSLDLGAMGGGGSPGNTAGTSPAAGDQSLRSLSPVALSSPIAAGLVLFLLALAAGVGVALRRMVRLIEAPDAASCPNKEGP
jgi:hypothetical protein